MVPDTQVGFRNDHGAHTKTSSDGTAVHRLLTKNHLEWSIVDTNRAIRQLRIMLMTLLSIKASQLTDKPKTIPSQYGRLMVLVEVCVVSPPAAGEDLAGADLAGDDELDDEDGEDEELDESHDEKPEETAAP